MSILSQISPSIYFGTLLTVYLLSSIDIVSNTLAYYFSWCSKWDAGDIEKVLRYVLIWINLIVYLFSILLAYGSTPFVNETKILGVKVEYSISSHLASIIPCVITLMLYLLHLRGRNLKRLDEELTPEQTQETVKLTAGIGENGTSNAQFPHVLGTLPKIYEQLSQINYKSISDYLRSIL
jgi:hypothetical protein